MTAALDLEGVTRALRVAGCVAAEEEAAELIGAAGDARVLAAMLERRLVGEPLAWITGRARFCDLDIVVDPGVYVPRWQSEPLARLAASLLGPRGVAVDLCTGAGAIARYIQVMRPAARVVATELDPLAASCARRNGVVVFEGDLLAALPGELASRVDVMTAVVPYVPTDALEFLPRDVLQFEPRRALDGGEHGLEQLSRVVPASVRFLRPGGWLLLEIGGDQVAAVTELFETFDFGEISVLHDLDGDLRGIYGRSGASPA